MEIQGGVREENEVGGGLKGKRISNFPSPCSLYLLGFFFFLKGYFLLRFISATLGSKAVYFHIYLQLLNLFSVPKS